MTYEVMFDLCNRSTVFNFRISNIRTTVLLGDVGSQSNIAVKQGRNLNIVLGREGQNFFQVSTKKLLTFSTKQACWAVLF